MAPDSNNAFITVARIAKTQGRHGEVAADLYTDFPEKFAERTQLSGLAKDGSRKDFEVDRKSVV